jgi:hypothetical protein
VNYITRVPGNRIEPLAWLGKTDWLRPTANGFRYSRPALQRLLDESVRYGRTFAHEVRDILYLSTSPGVERYSGGVSSQEYASIFYMASKVLATGQKTVRLSSEWCEAFEQTELTLQFADYKQPYPTMLVELPSDYATARFVPGAAEYPRLVGLHHCEEAGVLLVEVVFKGAQSHLSIPYRPDGVIEDVLRNLDVREKDAAPFPIEGSESYLAAFLRVALNAMTAMVYRTDWRKSEPTAPGPQRRRGGGWRGAAEARRAKLRLAVGPEVYSFDQTVRAFEEDTQTPPAGGPERPGTPKKPHWRRGHWRQQAVGEGRDQREYRWIRPTLVNAARFRGDPKDTTTTYDARLCPVRLRTDT